MIYFYNELIKIETTELYKGVEKESKIIVDLHKAFNEVVVRIDTEIAMNSEKMRTASSTAEKTQLENANRQLRTSKLKCKEEAIERLTQRKAL